MGTGSRDDGGGGSHAPVSRATMGRLKCGLRGAVLLYVVPYALFYRNTHLRREKVTGNVYVDMWPTETAKNLSLFQMLAYCQNPDRPCHFVNEVDLFSFEDNFIPTFVQVAQQEATCVDGSPDRRGCQLNYGTGSTDLHNLDSFYIGAIELYKVQFTHAFRSAGMGELTMADVVPLEVPSCKVQPPARGICRESSGGGHDQVTVEGLLAAGNLYLDANNAATNHPGGREGFRTSGLKLRVRVRYSNVAPWWMLSGRGLVGYRYEIEAIPARSVYHEHTIRSQEEMRAWVRPEKLATMHMYDRLLVWADGVDIETEVVGEVGHLDLSALFFLLACSLPLLYFAETIVELCVALMPTRKYEDVGNAEELEQVLTDEGDQALEGGEVPPL